MPVLRALAAADLSRIACPVCRGPLSLEGDLVRCTGCARGYLVVDGIPVLLAERAIQAAPPLRT